jgi:hypothetical protein
VGWQQGDGKGGRYAVGVSITAPHEAQISAPIGWCTQCGEPALRGADLHHLRDITHFNPTDCAVRAGEVEGSRGRVWPALDGDAARAVVQQLYSSAVAQVVGRSTLATRYGMQMPHEPRMPDLIFGSLGSTSAERNVKAVALEDKYIYFGDMTTTLVDLVHEVAHALLWVKPSDEVYRVLYQEQESRCPAIVEHDPLWMAVNLSLLAACGEVDVAARTEALWTRYATAPDYSQIPAPAIPHLTTRRWRLTDRWLAEAGMAMRGEPVVQLRGCGCERCGQRAAAGLGLG